MADGIDPSLYARVVAKAEALAKTPARVRRFSVDERVFWLKSAVAGGSWWAKLRKGARLRALAAEALRLEHLAAAGTPVPQIVHKGSGFLVLTDVGRSLQELLIDPNLPKAVVLQIFYQAGQTLALLHKRGLFHGRGQVKDFCWDTRRIALIDFEVTPANVHSRRHLRVAARRELVNFVYGCMRVEVKHHRPVEPALAAFRDGYLAAGGAKALKAAELWAQKRAWLLPALAPLKRFLPAGLGLDLRATGPALRALANLSKLRKNVP